MSDIFISYAPQDLNRVKPIAEAILGLGWDVCWGLTKRRINQPADKAIQEAISQAKVFVVCWSETSVNSRWVKAEANWAGEHEKKVVSVILDDGLRVPVPFDNLQSANLAGWSGDPTAPEFQKLYSDLIADLIWMLGLEERRRISEDLLKDIHPAPYVRIVFPDSFSLPTLSDIRIELPETLRWQLAARAFLDTTGEFSSAPVAADLPAEVSARPLAVPLGWLMRYALIAGGIAMALWLGAKLLPLVLGITAPGTPRKPEESSPDTTPVDCSIFAPPTIVVGREMLVQVYLHPPGTAEDAKAGAQQFDADAEWRGFTSLSLDLPTGIRVGVQLDVGDLAVSDDGIGAIRWNNAVAGVSFRVSAPKGTKLGKLHATTSFLVDGIPAGRIHFVIEVEASIKTDVPARGIGDAAHRYSKAFISYASEDRAEVLKRVQTLHALKIDFFQDVLDLEPGDRWERALYMEIDSCDLFLLFWSSASRASEWVHREASYALECQARTETGEPAIIPLLLEGPPPPKPWPEFTHLNFNDKLVYLMRIEEKGNVPEN